MNKRYLYIIAIVLALIAICVVEQILVTNYLEDMQVRTTEIVELSKNQMSINVPEIKEKVEEMDKIWRNYESTLCFLVNLKDIEDIGVELAKLKVYVSENSIVNFNESLALILHHLDGYSSTFGINFENIF